MAYVRDLDLYQNALDFSNKVWDLCIKWDYFAKKTVGDQLVRAVDSISANIAEGYGRTSVKDNLRFCYYAKGSLEEVKDWLSKAEYRKLLTSEKLDELNSELESISKSLWKYMNSMRKKVNS
jgi:four helix bundle protein